MTELNTSYLHSHYLFTTCIRVITMLFVSLLYKHVNIILISWRGFWKHGNVLLYSERWWIFPPRPVGYFVCNYNIGVICVYHAWLNSHYISIFYVILQYQTDQGERKHLTRKNTVKECYMTGSGCDVRTIPPTSNRYITSLLPLSYQRDRGKNLPRHRVTSLNVSQKAEVLPPTRSGRFTTN